MKLLCYILAFVAIIVLAVVAYVHQPKFGRAPQGERKLRIEHSPFFRDGKMTNETPTTMMTGKTTGRARMMWNFLTGRGKGKRLVPKEGEVEVVKTDLKHLPADGDLYIWFGHSAFLLRLSGCTILVDPALVDASPVPFIVKAFPGTDYYQPEMMPDTIDYLVISHDHWDHLDYRTVKALRNRIRHVVCPLGVGEDFEYWGYERERIIELDCNENHTTADGFTFHCLPTRHFSGRGLNDRMRTQRASWLIDSPRQRIFYSGDGGYSERFARYGNLYPDIDLAIMENGQYNEQWGQIHTLPHQLGREVAALHPRRFVTVHHSKYALARHDWDEPRHNEQRAARESHVPLVVAKIGEVVSLSKQVDE